MNKKENKILLIVEGEKTEPRIMTQYAKELGKSFSFDVISFGTNIYTLYSKIKELNDDFFGDDSTSSIEVLRDIFKNELDILIKRRDELLENGQGNKQLKSEIRSLKKKIELLDDKYPYIYLLFDFEYQDNTNKNKFETLIEMKNYFNDETENGLLLISYPMIESFNDYHKPSPDNDYQNKVIDLYDLSNYKKIVNERGNIDNIKKYKLDEFEGIVFQNIQKMNYIMNNKYEPLNYNDFINSIYNDNILSTQNQLVISNKKIAILCQAIFVYTVFLKKEYYNDIIYKFK